MLDKAETPRREEEHYRNPKIKDKPIISAKEKNYDLVTIWRSLLPGEEIPDGVAHTLAHLEEIGPMIVLGGLPAIDHIIEVVIETLCKNNPGIIFKTARGAGVISRSRIRKFVHGENARKNYQWEERQRRKLGRKGITDEEREKLLAQTVQDRDLTSDSGQPNLELSFAVFKLGKMSDLKHTRAVERIQMEKDRFRALYLRTGSLPVFSKDHAAENDQEGDDLNGQDTLTQE